MNWKIVSLIDYLKIELSINGLILKPVVRCRAIEWLSTHWYERNSNTSYEL